MNEELERRTKLAEQAIIENRRQTESEFEARQAQARAELQNREEAATRELTAREELCKSILVQREEDLLKEIAEKESKLKQEAEVAEREVVRRKEELQLEFALREEQLRNQLAEENRKLQKEAVAQESRLRKEFEAKLTNRTRELASETERNSLLAQRNLESTLRQESLNQITAERLAHERQVNQLNVEKEELRKREASSRQAQANLESRNNSLESERPRQQVEVENSLREVEKQREASRNLENQLIEERRIAQEAIEVHRKRIEELQITEETRRQEQVQATRRLQQAELERERLVSENEQLKKLQEEIPDASRTLAYQSREEPVRENNNRTNNRVTDSTPDPDPPSSDSDSDKTSEASERDMNPNDRRSPNPNDFTTPINTDGTRFSTMSSRTIANVSKMIPKLSRTFTSSKARSFLDAIESCRVMERIDDRELVHVFGLRLFDTTASNWWRRLLEEHGRNITWAVASRAFETEFIKKSAQAVAKKLMKQSSRKSGESIREFANRIKDAAPVLKISSLMAVHMFLNGVRSPEVTSFINSQKKYPEDLAKCLALLKERELIKTTYSSDEESDDSSSDDVDTDDDEKAYKKKKKKKKVRFEKKKNKYQKKLEKKIAELKSANAELVKKSSNTSYVASIDEFRENTIASIKHAYEMGRMHESNRGHGRNDQYDDYEDHRDGFDSARRVCPVQKLPLRPMLPYNQPSNTPRGIRPDPDWFDQAGVPGCGRCNTRGHVRERCSRANRTCNVCNQRGHINFECAQFRPAPRNCHGCGEDGHFIKDCPKTVGPNGNTSIVPMQPKN